MTDRPIRTVLFTIEKVAGSWYFHQTTLYHMLYPLECMDPTILNWSEGLIVSLKYQLTKFRQGEIKQFGYGVIVVSCFLERVPLLRL